MDHGPKTVLGAIQPQSRLRTRVPIRVVLQMGSCLELPRQNLGVGSVRGTLSKVLKYRTVKVYAAGILIMVFGTYSVFGCLDP